MQRFKSSSPRKTQDIGTEFAGILKPFDFVSLSGPLGAGKTRFSSGVIGFFCRPEGCKTASFHAASPTYSIMNSYECGGIILYHYDFYRLKTVNDLENAGFFDSLSDGGITIAEWGDAIDMDYGKFVSGSYYRVTIKFEDACNDHEKKTRIIEIEKIL